MAQSSAAMIAEPERPAPADPRASRAPEPIMIEAWMAGAVRTAYKARREREQLFGGNLFSDPAWDLLIYLFLATQDERGVTVTEACAAACVPTSTALRCIGYLVDRKLLVRIADPKDKRAALLYLSELGRDKLLSLLQRYCIAPVSAVL
jgi:DNA-binding MarR family transcriptional regulator